MRFVWRMAVRELRAGWRRLLFFFLCLSIGVGSVVALRSTIQNLNSAVTAEARQMLAADAFANSSRQWSAEELAAIERIARPPLVEARTETIDLPTMLRPADEAREGALMVELKAVESAYPLYGEFKLSDGSKFDHALLAGRGAVVSTGLLERLGLRPGDEVRIGEATFQVRAAFDQEPGGGGGGFRMGQRVFIARGAVEETGLVGFGSRARHRFLFRVRDDGTEKFVAELRSALRGTLVNVRSYRDAEESLNEQFTRSENYLALTGLVVLVLGGIGITNVTRVFIEQKKRAIAVLKCVGGTSRRLMLTYLAQTLALGLAGSLFGVLLARLALFLVEKNLSESLPPQMTYALRPGAALQGIALGLLVCLLFSALPLLRVRHIRPNTLLRDLDDASPGARRFDLVRWAATAAVVCGLVLVASWQAASFRVGAFFLGGLLATAGALYLAAWLLIKVVRRARGVRSFALRHAISSLHRPGNQTRTVVMAVGLGVFLILTIRALQTNLLYEFDPASRGRLPSMYLIDVRPEQRDGVAHLVERATGERAAAVPTVRARITAINGRAVDLDSRETRQERGRLGREYVVTYRPHLEANEEIVAGRFWDATPAPEAEVSIEEGMVGLGGLDVGGRVTFDVLGRRIDARVTSVRRVDWRNSRTGFLVLFRPGVLEQAPQTYVVPVGALKSEADRALPQRRRHRRGRDRARRLARARQRDAGRLLRRRVRALERRAHPRRLHRDDEVAAHLRGGGAQNSGRAPPRSPRHHARRVRPARLSRRNHRRGRGGRPLLRGRALRLRHQLDVQPRARGGGRRRHRAPRRGGRRDSQRVGAHPEAARHPAQSVRVRAWVNRMVGNEVA
jgi:putative ABC transport system permease protein